MLLSGDDFEATHSKGFSGLQYPTMQMRGNGDNFALKRAFAQSNLRFVAVHFMKVEKVDAARTHMVSTSINSCDGVTSDGYLVWQGHPKFVLNPFLGPMRGTSGFMGATFATSRTPNG